MSQLVLALVITIALFHVIYLVVECSRYNPVAILTCSRDILPFCSGHYIITMAIITLLLIAVYNDKYVDHRRY